MEFGSEAMRGWVVMICASVMLVAGCTKAPAIIGSYIASDGDYGSMIQINSVEDGAVKGAMTIINVGDRGAVNAVTRPLAGTLASSTLNLTVENGTGVSPVTGVVTKEGVELTFFSNGASQKLLFAKRNPDEFAALVASIRERGAVVKQGVEQAALDAEVSRQLRADQDRINSIAATLTDRSGAILDNIARVETVIRNHRRVSTRAVQLSTEQVAAASRLGRDDYRVEQISFTREQNANAARAAHDEIRDALPQFDRTAREREQDVAAAQALCASKPRLDCTGLSSAMTIYRQRAATFREVAAREDAAFRAEQARF